MSIACVILELMDNGGRRQFSYTNHIPDNRMIKDRRSGLDRRNGTGRRSDEVIFKKIQRPENDLREGIDRRNNLDRRVTFAEISAIQ